MNAALVVCFHPTIFKTKQCKSKAYAMRMSRGTSANDKPAEFGSRIISRMAPDDAEGYATLNDIHKLVIV